MSTVLAVYETRTKSEAPVIAPDGVIEAGRWIVAVRSAALADRTPDGRGVPDGTSALIVDIDLENRTAVTTSSYGDVLRLLDPPAGVDPTPTLYLKRDQTQLYGLNPRMKEAVQAVWLLPPSAPHPRTVTLSVTAETFKPKDNLYGTSGWFYPLVTVGKVTLEVAESQAMNL